MELIDVEKKLMEEKNRYDSLQPPIDLELRLSRALAKAPPRPRQINWQLPLAASFVLLFLFAGVNYDTLAYYGHRFLGYEGVMTETLQELKDQNKGQIINQSYTFDSGTKVTLDGIMADDNQMIAFYRLEGSALSDEDIQHQVYLKSSMRRNLFHSMTAEQQASGEYYCMATFKPAMFYEKSFIFQLEAKNGETAAIPFKLNRTQAMGSYYHQKISKDISVPPMEINLTQLTASATQTRLEGRIDTLASFAFKEITGENCRIHQTKWTLLADGKALDNQGSEWRTDLQGTTFALLFEPLPTDTEKISLTLDEVTFLFRPTFQLQLNQPSSKQQLSHAGHEIALLGWEIKDGNTHLYVQSAATTSILEVNLKTGDKMLDYREIRYHQVNPLTGQAVPHLKEIIFTGTGNNLSLSIGQMLCALTPENNTLTISIK
jgi:hypothetical protein